MPSKADEAGCQIVFSKFFFNSFSICTFGISASIGDALEMRKEENGVRQMFELAFNVGISCSSRHVRLVEGKDEQRFIGLAFRMVFFQQ